MARGIGDGVGTGRLGVGTLCCNDIAIERVAFDFLGNAIHRRDRLHRILPSR